MEIGVIGFFIISLIAYKREDEIEQRLSNHKIIYRILPFFICSFIAFLLAIKLDLSPFNRSFPGTDSSVFLYIGKAMQSGAIPYKDLFDHKGILLYFIEYLGYLIGFGNKIGVWLIELINLFFTTVIFYFIARLFTKSKIICYLADFIIISVCALSFFEGGNLVEEYALPWISLSLYLVIKFFITNEYKNWNILIIGAGFAIVSFLRINMVGLWGALILAVAICFIKNKRFFELVKCALLFLAGCAIVCLPILIYLLSTDSLHEMVKYYFTFNFAYTGSYSRRGIITFFFQCISLAGISSFFVFYSIYAYYKNKVVWLNLLGLSFAYLSSAISGRAYAHYAIIFLPFFVIPAVLTILPFMEKTKQISLTIKRKGVLISIIAICLLCSAINPGYEFYLKLSRNTSSSPVKDYVIENTSEKDDVLLLGNHAIFYIDSNRQTNNKFFYQEPPIEISDRLYDEFIMELNQSPPNYIISIKSDLSRYGEESNYYKVLAYLNESEMYRFEEYDTFQVYVRK